MIAKLLSGDLIILEDNFCYKEQLSKKLNVPSYRINLINEKDEKENDFIFVFIQDFFAEWNIEDTIVLDTRGNSYKKYKVFMNGNKFIVYKGMNGYTLENDIKMYGISKNIEVIYYVDKCKLQEKEQVEHFLYLL